MRKIDRALLFIQVNLRYDISLADVARYVGYTPDYFSRYFRRQMRISFSDYLNGKRLETASRLLLETDNSIEDIACDCGFNSSNWFRIRFKQRYGQTPTAFRRLMVKE